MNEINAQEAAELAVSIKSERAQKALTYIFSEIKRAAEEGEMVCHIDFYPTLPVITHLESLGYFIGSNQSFINGDGISIPIKWSNEKS